MGTITVVDMAGTEEPAEIASDIIYNGCLHFKPKGLELLFQTVGKAQKNVLNTSIYGRTSNGLSATDPKGISEDPPGVTRPHLYRAAAISSGMPKTAEYLSTLDCSDGSIDRRKFTKAYREDVSVEDDDDVSAFDKRSKLTKAVNLVPLYVSEVIKEGIWINETLNQIRMYLLARSGVQGIESKITDGEWGASFARGTVKRGRNKMTWEAANNFQSRARSTGEYRSYINYHPFDSNDAKTLGFLPMLHRIASRPTNVAGNGGKVGSADAKFMVVNTMHGHSVFRNPSHECKSTVMGIAGSLAFSERISKVLFAAN